MKKGCFISSLAQSMKNDSHLMRNKLSGVGGELGKDRCNGVEIRELNDTEKFTSQVFSYLLNVGTTSRLSVNFRHYLGLTSLF